MKKLISYLIVFVCFLSFIGSGYASEKSRYFHNLLYSIEYDVLKEYNKGSYLLTHRNMNSLEAVLTSELTDSDFSGNTLVICDTPYTGSLFTCDSSQVKSDELPVVLYKAYEFHVSKVGDSHILIVPESTFYNDSSRSAVKGFIKQLYESGTVPEEPHSKALVALDKILNQDLFTFTVQILFIVFLIGVAKLYFVRNRLLLNSVWVLVGAICFFVPVTTYLYIGKADDVSLSSLLTFLLSYLNPVIYIQNARDMVLLETALVFSMHVIVLMLFILFILPVLTKEVSSLNQSVGTKITSRLVGVFMLLFVFIISIRVDSFSSISLSLLFLVSVFTLNNAEKLDYANKRNIAHLFKYYSTLSIILLLILTAVTVYKKEATVSLADDDAYLPLYVEQSPSSRAAGFYAGNYPLLVNDLMLYYPGVSEIKNMPIDQYSHAANSIVAIFDSGDRIYKALHTNTELRSLFISEKVTSTLYFNADRGNSYSIELVFKCEDFKYEIDGDYKPFYYNTGSESFDTNAERVQFLKFAGCPTADPTTSYSFPLQLPENFVSGVLYLKLNDDLEKSIQSLNILEDGTKIPVSFLDLPEKMAIVRRDRKTSVIKGQPLHVYSQISEPIELKNTKDISNNLNFLLQNKIITRDMVLWSEFLGAFISKVEK